MSSSNREKWDLLSAVCVERKPVITPALNDLEQQYKQYLQEVEFEKSLKCDHEMKHESEKRAIESLKKGGNFDEEVNLKQTAQDFVDAANEELAQFKPAEKVTEPDKNNDLKSLERKLDKHLVLVLDQKIGDKNYFMLPQGVRQDGETLRQTAERVLRENCGDDIKVQIYGNAPCGFYKYKYPKAVQNTNGAVGAKVFFYFARYVKGQLPQEKIDYKWLDRTELQKNLPSAYSNSVSQFLLNN
ncbi:39S ribosomal protein L46, mitochondrial isoform X2 [Anoplophora glabripennis]|nr:39S ribosomal protein L46, mitochondrial isoform X2 [Anoplophora glabripennis]